MSNNIRRLKTRLVGLFAIGLWSWGSLAVAQPQTELASEINDRQAQGGSAITTGASCISGDGQVVGFYSEANNLARNPADSNGVGDLFVRRRGGATRRVSLGPNNVEANRGVEPGSGLSTNTNQACSLAGGGRRIVFASASTNLVTGEGNNPIIDVFMRDLDSGSNLKISQGANADSTDPTISSSGEFVAFVSQASNLDSACTNGRRHVFVADISNPNNIDYTCVSVNASRQQGDGNTAFPPSISGNGRFVVFDSEATNLVANDSNGERDVFLVDTNNGAIRRLSVSTSGGQANGPSDRAVISADGSTIAFVSAASNLVSNDTNVIGNTAISGIDVFVYDRTQNRLLGTRANVSSSGAQANVVDDAGFSPGIDPSISSDGRYIAFVSSSTNLVENDSNGVRDIFVRDRQEQITRLVSRDRDGGIANNRSFRPALSGDGEFVVFDSIATDLVANDTNNGFDVFIRGRLSEEGELEGEVPIFADDFEDPN